MAELKRIVISGSRKKFVPKGRVTGFFVFLVVAFLYLFSPKMATDALNDSINKVKVKHD